MTVEGQSLPKWVVRATSAYPPTATTERTHSPGQSRHFDDVLPLPLFPG
jgi:hypothetical protein